MNAIVALVIKDIRLLARDRLGLFFATLFPLIYAVVFGYMYGGGGGGPKSMPIAVVDEDSTEASRAFIDGLRAHYTLDIRPMAREEAADQVRRGKCSAYVILPEGYGGAVSNILAGQTPAIELGADPARPMTAGMLRGILTKEAFAGLQRSFTDPDVLKAHLADAVTELKADPEVDPALRDSLVELYDSLDSLADVQTKEEQAGDGTDSNGEDPWEPFRIEATDVQREGAKRLNGYAVSFPQGAAWALIGCAAAFSMTLVSERTRGTLQRLLIAPLNRGHILAGKTLACLVTTVASTAAVLFVGAAAFDVRPHSYLCLVLAVGCAATAFTGVMMLLAVLGKTELSASGISWAALLLMALIGGAMTPLAMMPGWIRVLSNISPVKWAVYALEGAMWRAFSLSEMTVPCLVLLGIGIVGFVAGLRLFQWRAAA